MNIPILYSCGSKLALYLNKTFYNDIHYVWCSPAFNPKELGSTDPRCNIPYTSSPFEIYLEFLKGSKSNDRHSRIIEENRKGLIKGATFKHGQKVIGDQEFAMIQTIVSDASPAEFKPWIYIIPYELVKNKIHIVNPKDRANVLSIEYQIHDLKSGEFDLICEVPNA